MKARFYEYGLYRPDASAIFLSYSTDEIDELQRLHNWAITSFGEVVYSKTYERYQEHLIMFQNDTNNRCLMAAKLAWGWQ